MTNGLYSNAMHGVIHKVGALPVTSMDNGVPLHDVQDSLGQANPRTTRFYNKARNKLTKTASYDVVRAPA